VTSRLSLAELLDRAVAKGVITAEQGGAIRDLAAESEPPAAARDAGREHAGTEARRGFNVVSIAYGLGALLVVFAFAWFLFDRWEALGPWGVFAVSLVYAALCVGVSVWLERRGFRDAGGVALMLAVSLAAVVSWSLVRATGLLALERYGDPFFNTRWWTAPPWIVVDLGTILAALLALRVRAHPALTLPLAVALWFLWMHLTTALSPEESWGPAERWLLLANGLAICAIAGRVDRWQAARRASGRPADGDYAFFFWLAGLVAAGGAYLSLWFDSGGWRHLLPAVAIALIVAALYLRRRLHLVFGVAGVFVYLGWLADSFFRQYLGLPVTIATLGILLILATVWLQRRFPALVRRVNEGRVGQALPRMATLGPFLFAVGMALLALPETREWHEQQRFRARLWVLQQHSGSARARNGGDRVRSAPPPPPEAQPPGRSP
jgi:hypothetical protein